MQLLYTIKATINFRQGDIPSSIGNIVNTKITCRKRKTYSYEVDYFVGTVIGVLSPGVAIIQFLQRGENGSFRWPTVIDFPEVSMRPLNLDGVHINSIHVTTVSSCYVIAVDEMSGGTAVDYSDHICQSIDNLASRYSEYTDTKFQTTRTNIIDNISNCMMDRVAGNHGAIVLVNEAWHKTISELNCHLHPLDSIASS